MKNKSVLLAIGVSLSLGVATSSSAFQIEKLNSGYNNANNSFKLAQGKCGNNKAGEGKCGSKENKQGAGNCGSEKNKKSNGKCGSSKDKAASGKCGAGKCGA